MLLLLIRRNQIELLKEIGNKAWEPREGVAEIKVWVTGVEMRAGALNVTSSPSQCLVSVPKGLYTAAEGWEIIWIFLGANKILSSSLSVEETWVHLISCDFPGRTVSNQRQ